MGYRLHREDQQLSNSITLGTKVEDPALGIDDLNGLITSKITTAEITAYVALT